MDHDFVKRHTERHEKRCSRRLSGRSRQSKSKVRATFLYTLSRYLCVASGSCRTCARSGCVPTSSNPVVGFCFSCRRVESVHEILDLRISAQVFQVISPASFREILSNARTVPRLYMGIGVWRPAAVIARLIRIQAMISVIFIRLSDLIQAPNRAQEEA